MPLASSVFFLKIEENIAVIVIHGQLQAISKVSLILRFRSLNKINNNNDNNGITRFLRIVAK